MLSLWLGGNFCEAPALRGISDAQILVVDAGATKTSAVLVQVGSGENVEVIASVRTGPANPVSVGWETAVQNLWQACEEVLRGFRSEQSSKPKVHYAVLAIAGTGKEETRSRLAQWFAGLGIAESFCILPDVALLVAGVSNEGVGIALVAGTGSASWGINSTGQVARTGGWGFFLDDLGSAYWMGRKALEATVRVADGRDPESQLLPQILQHLGLGRVEDLIPLSPRFAKEPALVAQLAPIVLECSSEGDLTALGILEQARNYLVELVRCTAWKLGWGSGGFPLAVGGGLLENFEKLRGMALERLQAIGCPPAAMTLVDPLAAAIRFVRQALVEDGWPHWAHVYHKQGTEQRSP